MTISSQRWQGGRPLVAAVEEVRASFAGFHRYARDWLADNPRLAADLANRIGYWFFIHAVSLPASIQPGSMAKLGLRIENRGVAPLYYPAHVRLRLSAKDGGEDAVITLPTADPSKWAPRQLYSEAFSFGVPAQLSPGIRGVELAFVDIKTNRLIKPALSKSLRTADGYYRIGETSVT